MHLQIEQPETLPTFVTARELAEVFRVSLDTVNDWQRDGHIPRPIQINPRGARRWDLSKVLEAVQGDDADA